jgi:hypothetical protein
MRHRQIKGVLPPALAEPVRLAIQKCYYVSPGKDSMALFIQLECASTKLTIILSATALVFLLLASLIVLRQREIKTF